MNPSEVKDILAGFDLTEPQNLPPEAATAYEFAQNDPALSAWIADMISFDQQFGAALTDIEIPTDLEDSILVAAGAERPRFQRLAMLATAAAIALAAVFAISILQTPTTKVATKTTEQFRSDMVELISGEFELDFMNEKIAAAKKHLDDLGYPTFKDIPERIFEFRGMGCKAVDWGEHKVGFICTVNEQDQLVHLFIIDRDALADIDNLETPIESLVISNDRQTGGWQDEENVYLLIASTPEVKIAPLLR